MGQLEPLCEQTPGVRVLGHTSLTDEISGRQLVSRLTSLTNVVFQAGRLDFGLLSSALRHTNAAVNPTLPYLGSGDLSRQ